MTSEIKPIETVYRGYRFRSRLEARWAVFFDNASIPFEYEKEGFDVRGTWYLPDFWLPEQRCWVEIKGEMPSEEYISMLRDFGQKDYPLVMFVGLPGEQLGHGWCGQEYHGESGGCFDADHVEFVLNEHGEVCLTVGIDGSVILDSSGEHSLGRLTPSRCVYDSPRLTRSYVDAKQARF